MASVLDLTEIFSSSMTVSTRDRCRSIASSKGVRDGLHVFLDLGHKINAKVLHEGGEPLGDIALVGIQFAKEPLGKGAQGLAVIHIARREFDA